MERLNNLQLGRLLRQGDKEDKEEKGRREQCGACTAGQHDVPVPLCRPPRRGRVADLQEVRGRPPQEGHLPSAGMRSTVPSLISVCVQCFYLPQLLNTQKKLTISSQFNLHFNLQF